MFCNGSDSCLLNAIYCKDNIVNPFIYNSYLELITYTENACIPWNVNKTNITCDSGKDCVVNCTHKSIINSPYYLSYNGCSSITINGNMSNSLYIDCSLEYGCINSNIYYPNNYNNSISSTCNITCG